MSEPADQNREMRDAVSAVPDGLKAGPLKDFAGAEPPAPNWFTEAVKTPYEEHFIEVHGARIQYLRWGDKRKPGLILAHGNGAHAFWWAFIAPYLARNYNVIAPTFSGMGDSAWRQKYVAEQFVDELMICAEQAGMMEAHEPPVIAGHSFGGFVAIMAGALVGEKLSGIVVVDAPIKPPKDRTPSKPIPIRPTKVYPDMASALARFRLAPAQTCENLFIVDYVARRSLRQVEGGWTWKFDPHIWRRFYSGDPAELLKKVTCRIAIFRAENSAIFPPEVGPYMQGLLGHHVPVVEIPEAQHHLILDQPIAFVAALRTLLGEWDHSVSKRILPE